MSVVTLQAVTIAVLSVGALTAQAYRVHRPPFLRIIAALGWGLLCVAAIVSLTSLAGHTRALVFAALTLIAAVETSLSLGYWFKADG